VPSLKNWAAASLLCLGILGGCADTPPNVEVSVTPAASAVAAGESLQFSAMVQGDSANEGVTWSVNGMVGGNSTVGTIGSSGNYVAPMVTQPVSVTVTATSIRNKMDSNTADLEILVPGTVSSTANPLVALYTFMPPAGSTVAVNFGPDTNYGLMTNTLPAPTDGSPLKILVAGMRASLPYHLRAVVQLANGVTYNDPDSIFTTGAIPGNLIPSNTVTTTPGMTPQPGIELLDSINPNGELQITAVDLSGNIIWYYNYLGANGDYIQPVHPMANGDFLVVISPDSTYLLTHPTLPAGSISVVREIDLAGDTVKEISIDDLNTKLTNAGYTLTLGNFHHDVLPLANGHWIVLANTLKDFTDLPYHPGTISVMGDVLVDLDENLNPVWVWNEFDHLNINRQPINFPDWTHTNAVIYSPDDGNLLVSIRHQDWVLKVDYENGNGNGDIIWHLGYQGDFTLSGGVTPTDWFYGQHGPQIVTPNSTGQFAMTLLDNGFGRFFPAGDPCAQTVTPNCRYTTIPVLQIDDQAMTAQITFHDTGVPFSLWGGNAEVLKNGNVEFNDCAAESAPAGSEIYEVTQSETPQVVWHLHVNGQNAYRGLRIPSLYPGVQW